LKQEEKEIEINVPRDQRKRTLVSAIEEEDFARGSRQGTWRRASGERRGLERRVETECVQPETAGGKRHRDGREPRGRVARCRGLES